MAASEALLVGEREFFLDLLFYHHTLRRFIVIELKIGAFQPEYVSKMNFYLNALDEQLRTGDDRESVGIILCAERDEATAKLAVAPRLRTDRRIQPGRPEDPKRELPPVEVTEDVPQDSRAQRARRGTHKADRPCHASRVGDHRQRGRAGHQFDAPSRIGRCVVHNGRHGRSVAAATPASGVLLVRVWALRSGFLGGVQQLRMASKSCWRLSPGRKNL